jgi:hypothetical protein
LSAPFAAESWLADTGEPHLLREWEREPAPRRSVRPQATKEPTGDKPVARRLKPGEWERTVKRHGLPGWLLDGRDEPQPAQRELFGDDHGADEQPGGTTEATRALLAASKHPGR